MCPTHPPTVGDGCLAARSARARIAAELPGIAALMLHPRSGQRSRRAAVPHRLLATAPWPCESHRRCPSAEADGTLLLETLTGGHRASLLHIIPAPVPGSGG